MSESTSALEAVDRAYDSPPWWYDLRGLFILTFSYRSHLAAQLGFFAKNMGQRHLEAAVGSGSLLELALWWRRAASCPPTCVVAFDYAEAMLSGARRRFAQHPDVIVLRADAGRLPLPDSEFDTVNIANAIHCFSDIDAALGEVRRVLRPGGTLAVNVLLRPRGNALSRRIASAINDWGMRKGILFRPYEEDDVLRRIAGAGLEVTSTRLRGNALEILAQKVEVRP